MAGNLYFPSFFLSLIRKIAHMISRFSLVVKSNMAYAKNAPRTIVRMTDIDTGEILYLFSQRKVLNEFPCESNGMRILRNSVESAARGSIKHGRNLELSIRFYNPAGEDGAMLPFDKPVYSDKELCV